MTNLPNELRGMRVFLVFAVVAVAFYVYSMMIGYRFLGRNETTHTRERDTNRTNFHRTYFHK